jgi:hypothetical protein
MVLPRLSVLWHSAVLHSVHGAFPILLHLVFMHKMHMDAGFQVFTAMTVKSNIFWDMQSCSLVDVHRPFGGTYCLLLHGPTVNRARNQELGSKYTAPVLKMEAVHISETSVIVY